MKNVVCYPCGKKAPAESDPIIRAAKAFVSTQKTTINKPVTPIKSSARDPR
ncbi:MAG: hypothetical protein J6Y53_03390 [Alphaproteobacteria bacterium]|nr:hypothetical protein [Alphaproteobacteria bacterium]